MHRASVWICLACLFTPTLGLYRGENYKEDLRIQPLRDGRVSTTFSFVTVLEGAVPRNPKVLGQPDESQHYALFPLTLGQILREYAITELHLTLNAGKWNYDNWGHPPEAGVSTGAELWAWMGTSELSTVDERWSGLRNALSGLFCASLGSLDSRRTTSPTVAFPLSGSTPPFGLHELRHASLPSENVCTENLTPFLKLLPCKSHAGLAALLNPQKVFDADWHGMAIHVIWKEDVGVELKLTLQAVFNPVRTSAGKRRDWNLQSLFDRSIERSCPVASSSSVTVIIPEEKNHQITPKIPAHVDGLAVYDFSSSSNFTSPSNIAMYWPNEHSFQYPLPPLLSLTPLSVKRTIHGTTQTRGVLSVSVTNNSPQEVSAGYLEMMPALLTLWMHTLKVEINSQIRSDLLSGLKYHPPSPQSSGRLSPSMLQAVLTIPPKSTLKISMEVNKAFLKYTEHPPDAMRGWDLPGAVFFPLPQSTNDASSGHGWERIYTPPLLVDLPTPDFSMPYNVIILSCTLMTLIFGSVFNLLTRKWVVVEIQE
ncbi:Gpi16 subunit GPI transamidase component [Suillus clintonianus]|uniref:Gpi16 subunit GPI transamidase component n=1 Tax=Suillus clintonianus TaxID=1904413 RepID=UPI001B884284|nr:Gpi16 subunit GPI transamidase component [Suillus clintonianus]KAG2128702.1 Gpi16 subunit GPI transamidase component [Suillus clintonianus]